MKVTVYMVLHLSWSLRTTYVAGISLRTVTRVPKIYSEQVGRVDRHRCRRRESIPPPLPTQHIDDFKKNMRS
jgi:hypothetical protein